MICIIACRDNKVFCPTTSGHPRLAFGPLGHLSIHLIKMQMEILQIACNSKADRDGRVVCLVMEEVRFGCEFLKPPLTSRLYF